MGRFGKNIPKSYQGKAGTLLTHSATTGCHSSMSHWEFDEGLCVLRFPPHPVHQPPPCCVDRWMNRRRGQRGLWKIYRLTAVRIRKLFEHASLFLDRSEEHTSELQSP